MDSMRLACHRHDAVEEYRKTKREHGRLLREGSVTHSIHRVSSGMLYGCEYNISMERNVRECRRGLFWGRKWIGSTSARRINW